jgi:alkanesulfonate monooxygenase SsuD/methylene tetrahydromethanopterin reductase-like flavin-dependent oxidoreductase (luciferase family)
VQLGLALPQYDGFSAPNQPSLDWPTLSAYAQRAEQAGFDSLWLSDHVVWAIDRYGAAPGNHEGYDPIPTLAALARLTTTAALGTLVLATPLRPPTILAKALTGIDRISNGRLIAGLGAGWFEPDYALTGQDPNPTPGERLARLSEAIDVIKATFRGDGTPPNLPPPVQQPHPPIWIGGKGPRLIKLAAAKADGWNFCWQASPDSYRVIAEAAVEAGIHQSLGIYTLVGENERDLQARWQRLKQTSPPGVIKPDTTLDEYRLGRLVGTVDQAAEQVQAWEQEGVQTLIACTGAVPFSVTALDDLEVVAASISAVR